MQKKILRSRPAFECQPVLKSNTETLVDPPFIACFCVAFLSFFFFFAVNDRKIQKNLLKCKKKWFWPANGVGTTRLLVKILNICLQFYNLHQGPSWLSLLVFIGYYNCQSNLVVKKLGKFLVTSDFSTEVLLNVRKKDEKQNKKCSH